MSTSARFPARALARYAEILLRHVYQAGGRDRYVRVAEIEDALGLEADLILELCRTRLVGEIQIACRLPAEVRESIEYRTPLERQLIEDYCAQPHLRIRPEPVRLTEKELLKGRKKRKRKRARARRRA